MEIGKCTCSEHTLYVKEMKMVLKCFSRTHGLHRIQFHAILFMSLLSIQLIFSLSSFVCFPFFPIYMQVFLGLEPQLQVSRFWIHTTTSALESNLYFILSLSCHLHFMFVLWRLYARFPLDILLMLCLDNGSAHNLLVGSEPTHCCCYLYLCIFVS